MSYRIMGIDAGFTAMGICAVEITTPGLPFGSVLWAECIKTERESKRESVSLDDARRIQGLVRTIVKVHEMFKPNEAVVELPVGGAKGAQAIKGMAFSTAMCIAALTVLGLKTTYINPFQNKEASTGRKHAEKLDVINAVKMTWPTGIHWPPLKKKAKEDRVQCEAIADALSTIMARVIMGMSSAPPR